MTEQSYYNTGNLCSTSTSDCLITLHNLIPPPQKKMSHTINTQDCGLGRSGQDAAIKVTKIECPTVVTMDGYRAASRAIAQVHL